MTDPALIDRATGALAIAQDALKRAGISGLARDAETLRVHLLRLKAALSGSTLRRRRTVSLEIEPYRSLDPSEEEMLTFRARKYLPRIGWGGARVLMRLLESPGRHVSVRDLAEAAKVRGPRHDVIKVYICRLRSALGEKAIEAPIVTGKGSYMLRGEVASPILDALR